MTAEDPPIRDPEEIRRDCVGKLKAVQVSEHFLAMLGCLLGENWTTPRLVEMVITPDGHLLGRREDEATFKLFLGASDDLIKNIHGLAAVAELDGDEVGWLGNRSQVGDWSIFRLKNLAMQTPVPRKHGPVPLKSRQIVNQGVNGYRRGVAPNVVQSGNASNPFCRWVNVGNGAWQWRNDLEKWLKAGAM